MIQDDYIKGQWKLSDLKTFNSIPPHSPYGLAFYIPHWSQIEALVNEESDIFSKIVYGYPRFIIHGFVKKLNQTILESLRLSDVRLFCLPSLRITQECQKFIIKYAKTEEQKKGLDNIRLEIFKISCTEKDKDTHILNLIVYPPCLEIYVLIFWETTGEILSTRFAAHCLRLTGHKKLVSDANSDEKYVYTNENEAHYTVSLEQGDMHTERDMRAEKENKLKLRERIANLISFGERISHFPTPDDVFLFPTGMSAIYNAVKLALSVSGEYKSVCFGFPFKDSKKLLESFGNGLHFLGNGEQDDLVTLETILQTEKIAFVFSEFPTNPLLKSSDLLKLRQLADQYKFILIVDDTLGNIINLQDQLIADIVVTSLTKIFSGYSDVMGGSSRYQELISEFNKLYQDTFWCEEAATLERNSRDVITRAQKANKNGELLADCLRAHPLVKRVHYPKYTTSALYKTFQRPQGGYGSLLVLEFCNPAITGQFYELLPVAKGPSLGANFTLMLPYIKLCHFKELSEIAQYGCYDHLIRISIGIEDSNWLCRIFTETLDKIQGDSEQNK